MDILSRRSLIKVAIAAAVPIAIPREVTAHTWLWVPEYKQAYSLSCEFASLYMVTSYWGAPIYEDDSLSVTTWNLNPHLGFRGDITGNWGDTWDYGIYANPLASIAYEFGFGADIVYDPSAEALIRYLDAGIPVIVWASVRYEQGWYEWDEAGNRYKLVPYEHVFVVNGYDDEGVHISDPGPGTYGFLDWTYFLETWAIMDGMMLAVYRP
jgi:uncharacterized protein YvpB